MTLDDMAALHALCFPDAPWSESELWNLLDQPMVHLVTVSQGFLIASMIPPEAEIITLCVSPEHRREGKAGALLSLLFQEAEVVHLEVAADNDAALALYASYGFEESGRRPAYYRRADGAKVDAVTMRCALT